MLWVALHLPQLRSQALARGHAPPEPERAALAAVGAWLGQFTPRVSLEPPQGVAAEVRGSLELFGGAAALAERIRQGIAELGFEAMLAFAPTARAALWRAAGGGQALEALPLVALGLAPEALELAAGLGLRTLGELERLPRAGLAQRFGPALLEALDRARGRLPEPRALFVPPERYAARLELPGEALEAGSVLFAARRLLAGLEGFLAARHAGVRRFALELLHRKAPPARIEIGLAGPAREAAHCARLLGERLGRLVLAAPVEAIRLEATALEPLPGSSRGLWRDAREEGEDWLRLIERLQARLGSAAVHGLAPHSEHRPERAWRALAPGVEGRCDETPPGPRPLWLLDPPRRLGEADFVLLAGPERIESGWWDGEEAKRDYFVARSGEASLLWVFRDPVGWHLHGIFA